MQSKLWDYNSKGDYKRDQKSLFVLKMTLFQIILIIIFVLATVVGYILINNVPSLLHTPLMSGMNALSGITILGALTATAASLTTVNPIFGYIFGSIAIICAMVNVVGGFGITDRMLRMIVKKENKDDSR